MRSAELFSIITLLSALLVWAALSSCSSVDDLRGCTWEPVQHGWRTVWKCNKNKE